MKGQLLNASAGAAGSNLQPAPAFREFEARLLQRFFQLLAVKLRLPGQRNAAQAVRIRLLPQIGRMQAGPRFSGGGHGASTVLVIEGCGRRAVIPEHLTARGAGRRTGLRADALEIQRLAMSAVTEVKAFILMA